MNPNEKIQDLESKNIRLKDQHNKDVELLLASFSALTKAKNIHDRYEIQTAKLQELNNDIMKDWKKTIDLLRVNLLSGILLGIILLLTVQDLAEIFLK